jgi:hypothetical protein
MKIARQPSTGALRFHFSKRIEKSYRTGEAGSKISQEDEVYDEWNKRKAVSDHVRGFKFNFPAGMRKNF